MSDYTDTAKHCPDCDAANVPMAVSCWLCHREITGVTPTAVIERGGRLGCPNSAPSESFTILVATMSGLLVLLVGYGVFTAGPGALIPYAIVAVPALLATAIRLSRRSARGEKVTAVEAVGTFLISGVAVFGLLVLLVITLIIGLIIYCFAELARH